MIVMKFGGSSLASGQRICEVGFIIKSHLHENPVIVLSAMGKTTDTLLNVGERALIEDVDGKEIILFHQKIIEDLGIKPKEVNLLFEELQKVLKGISMLRELSSKTKDYLASFGERLSVRIFAEYLTQQGINAKYFDAWELGLRSTSIFTDAEVLPESYDAIASSLQEVSSSYAYTPIITGFLSKEKNDNITTLGRGGSDLTASVIGAAIGAKEIQVWKDVDGLLTTDPLIVPQAMPVSTLSLEEASELAYFGAKILHPRSIIPVIMKNIPVRIKNSHNPTHEGTVIMKEVDPPFLVRAITLKRNITLIDIVSTRMLGQFGFLAHVFRMFEKYGISVDMVATSEVSISVTLDNNDGFEELVKELERFSIVQIKTEKTIISIIGNIQKSSQILGMGCQKLAEENINVQMISQGASKVNIGFIVNNKEADTCVRTLHKLFFEGNK